MTIEQKAVHDAAEILGGANPAKWHEHFSAIGVVENGERSPKRFDIELHTTQLGFSTMMAQAVIELAKRDNADTDFLLRRVANEVKRLKRGGHCDA